MGAYDGVFASNSLFFERELGWTGICLEPHPIAFEKLQKNRSCTCVHGCVGLVSGEEMFVMAGCNSSTLSLMDPRHSRGIDAPFREMVTVKRYTFNDLMRQHGVDHIDYFSLDIEGGELEVLQSIDFDTIRIDVISVESNYPDLRKKMLTFMAAKGYVWMTKCGVDDLFRPCRLSVRNCTAGVYTIERVSYA